MVDDLGARLKYIRKKKNLSLRALGKSAYVSHSFIADIEAGRSNPSLDTLRALARTLGVSISEITGDIPSDFKPNISYMFGSVLKDLREKAGMSQKRLADIIGLTQQTIAKWEKDKAEPDTETLIKLAELFEVSVDQLLGRQKINIEIYSNHDNNQSISYVAEAPTNYPTHLKEPTLTKQDREELKRDAEYIKNAMMNVTGLAFNNRPQDDETLEKVMAALEEAMILARKEAQKKYTPKKYRKED